MNKRDHVTDWVAKAHRCILSRKAMEAPNEVAVEGSANEAASSFAQKVWPKDHLLFPTKGLL